MRTKNILSLFLIVILLFYSCKNNKTDVRLTEIKISPKISNDEILQSLIKDIKIIKLQTTDSALIKYIWKLEYIRNRFYIQTLPNKPIFVFDSIGNYIYSIGKHGKGPGEFIQLVDYLINEEEDNVILFSWPDKTLYYTLDGKYLRETKAKLPIYKSIKINKNLFAVYIGCGTIMPDGEEPPSDIVFTDANFNIISKYKKRPAYKNKMGAYTNIFSKWNENISYLGEYSYTVCLIKNKNLIPQFYLNFGEYQITEEFLKRNQNINPVEYFNKIKNEYAHFIRYAQNENYFWVEYYLKLNTLDKHFAIYSKKDSKVLNFSCDKKQPLTKLLSTIISNYKEEFIFLVEASDFKEISEDIKDKLVNSSTKKTKYLNDILKISSQTKETDNPLLIILTLKHN